MSQVIRCGLVVHGKGNFKYHALRADGTAACSNFILVEPQPFSITSISAADRCKSPACRKLFAVADEQANSHGAGDRA